jgi:hypothetical protein
MGREYKLLDKIIQMTPWPDITTRELKSIFLGIWLILVIPIIVTIGFSLAYLNINPSNYVVQVSIRLGSHGSPLAKTLILKPENIINYYKNMENIPVICQETGLFLNGLRFSRGNSEYIRVDEIINIKGDFYNQERGVKCLEKLFLDLYNHEEYLIKSELESLRTTIKISQKNQEDCILQKHYCLSEVLLSQLIKEKFLRNHSFPQMVQDISVLDNSNAYKMKVLIRGLLIGIFISLIIFCFRIITVRNKFTAD